MHSHRKQAGIVLLPLMAVLCLAPSLSPAADRDVRRAGLMQPDARTRKLWMDEYLAAPEASMEREIARVLAEAERTGLSTSMSLLDWLDYDAEERDQGSCGNCWVWASTGVMELALKERNMIRDRLSVQLLNSCRTEAFACCGGFPSTFADWYWNRGSIVPWSSDGAAFADAGAACSITSRRDCADIDTSIAYPITQLNDVRIATTGMEQAQAIANIKNVLNQNKGIFFGFWLPTWGNWDDFFDFWEGDDRETLWDTDSLCGGTWSDTGGGGHAVLIVGYNDDDADPDNHYWIVLNSWGTGGGNRPAGLFRMPMRMNYDCTFRDGGQTYWSRMFWTFEVDYGPTLNINKPDGGETWLRGTTKSVTWNYMNNPGDTVRIDLYRGGVLDRTVSPAAPIGTLGGFGRYRWSIPARLPPGKNYRMKIVSTADSSYWDISGEDFTVCRVLPSLKLVEPNGGELFFKGREVGIRWKYSGDPPPGDRVRIKLLKGGEVHSVITERYRIGSRGRGAYRWILPADLPAGNDFRVKVSVTGASAADRSDKEFTLEDPPERIILLSPNGGERWLAGTTRNISWIFNESPGETLTLRLFKPLSKLPAEVIASGVPAGEKGVVGSFQWQIPIGTPAGRFYRVEAVSEQNAYFRDTGNGPFRIRVPRLKVLSPDGGEALLPHQRHTIRWEIRNMSDDGSRVSLDLLKGGAPFLHVADGVYTGAGGSGSWDWIPVDIPNGRDYRLTISSYNFPELTDTSDEDFTVKNPVLVTAPAEGAPFFPGEDCTLSWVSTRAAGLYVKIILFPSGGEREVLARRHPAGKGGGSYTWTIPPDQPPGNHSFKVVSTANSDYHDFSPTFHVLPASPAAVTAGDGTSCSSVPVSWSPVSGISLYVVYRSLDNDPAGAEELGSSHTVSFSDTTADPGVVYHYWVRAVAGGAFSDFAGPDTGFRAEETTPPTAVSATDGTLCSRVRVTWNPVPSATGYTVLRKFTAISYETLGTVAAPPFDDTTGEEGTEYLYAVRAENGCGQSDVSSEDGGTSGVPVNAPTLTGVSDNRCDSIRVSWNGVPGAASYQVWGGATSSAASSFLLGTVDASPYDDESVAPGDTRWYWVKAVGTCSTSGFSSGGEGVRPGPVSTPVMVGASDDRCGYVRLWWNAVAGAEGYQIWRNTSSTTAGATLVGTDDASPFDDTAVTGGVPYWYWVRAVGPCNTSGYSASDSGIASPAVSAPTGTAASSGFCGYTRVSWNAAAGSAGYRILRHTSNLLKDAVQVGTDTASPWDDTGAVPRQTYYYWVASVDACGVLHPGTADTGWLNATPEPPAAVSADGYLRYDILVTWDVSPGATSYSVWRGTTTLAKDAVQIGTAGGTSFTDTTAVPMTTYYYWIKAANSCGTSAFSPMGTAVLVPPG